jgi:hypothetical protein
MSAPAPRPLPARAPWPGLALRALMELAIVAGVGWWGHVTIAWPAGIALALLAAALWALPVTPGDPGHPNGLVRIPGALRLVIEAALLGLAAAAIWTAWNRAAAETLLTAALLDAVFTWDRLRWLLRAPAAPDPRLG